MHSPQMYTSPGPFNEGTDIAITLATETTEGVLFGGARATGTAANACYIPTGRHTRSFSPLA